MNLENILRRVFVVGVWLLMAHSNTGVADLGVLLFGDSGMSNPNQKRVAQAMKSFCEEHRCDLVTLLGDNIYPSGVSSESDLQWKEKFEVPFMSLQLPFYPVFGNHDYHGSLQAQIDYSKLNPNWKFPSRFYRFKEGDGEFFMLDTENLDAEQLKWLDESLTTSLADWKIVCGHRPIYSHGGHGDSSELKEKLLPLLKNRVDLYFSGHDHNLEFMDKGYHPKFVVSGASSDVRKVGKGKSTVFAANEYGFGHLLIQKSKAEFVFVDADGKILFEKKLRTRKKSQ